MLTTTPQGYGLESASTLTTLERYLFKIASDGMIPNLSAFTVVIPSAIASLSNALATDSGLCSFPKAVFVCHAMYEG